MSVPATHNRRVFVGAPGDDEWEDWSDEQAFDDVVTEMEKRRADGRNNGNHVVVIEYVEARRALVQANPLLGQSGLDPTSATGDDR